MRQSAGGCLFRPGSAKMWACAVLKTTGRNNLSLRNTHFANFLEVIASEWHYNENDLSASAWSSVRKWQLLSVPTVALCWLECLPSSRSLTMCYSFLVFKNPCSKDSGSLVVVDALTLCSSEGKWGGGGPEDLLLTIKAWVTTPKRQVVCLKLVSESRKLTNCTTERSRILAATFEDQAVERNVSNVSRVWFRYYSPHLKVQF